MPVWRTCRSTASRTCSTASRLAPAWRDRLQQRGEPAGAVGDDREDAQAPPDRGLVAAREQRQQAGVDVAAREHDDGRSRTAPTRRCAVRAATPTAPAPSTTSFARSISSTIASAVSSSLTTTTSSTQRCDERQRDAAGALDRDAVGDRRGRVDGERGAGGERGRERRARGDLHADDRDLGARELDHAGDAGDQAAAADRHDHLREVGDLLEQLEAERRLADDHVRIVERVHEDGAGLGGALARRRDAVVDAVAAERDIAAVALRPRRPSRPPPRPA